jgi:hypothetical protein
MSSFAPVVPNEIAENIGMAAAQRVQMRNEILTKYRLAGGIPPATILNMGPKNLTVRPGFINHVIPKCPDGKNFSVTTISTFLTSYKLRGGQERADGTMNDIFEAKEVLPAEQLLEYLSTYNLTTTQGAELGGDDFLPQGGIVVYQGTEAALTSKDRMVTVPYYTHVNGKRYLAQDIQNVDTMITDAYEQIKLYALAVIRKGTDYADGGIEERKNLDARVHFVWHDWALHKKIITKAAHWRNIDVREADRCESCGDQYVSKTGVCKCNWVRYPLLAYMKSAITIDHARMDSLNQDEWKKVHVEEARRKAARG